MSRRRPIQGDLGRARLRSGGRDDPRPKVRRLDLKVLVCDRFRYMLTYKE